MISVFRTISEGNFSQTIGNTWTDVAMYPQGHGATFDLLVPGAKVGDLVNVEVDGRVGNGGDDYLHLDMHSIGGTAERSWTTGVAPSGLHAGGVLIPPLVGTTVTYRRTQDVLASDLTQNGQVRLRLRWRNNGITSATHSMIASDTGQHMAMRATVTRADRVIVLRGGETYEGAAVGEANVWHEGGVWNMTYSAGWNLPVVCYATAPGPEGPWTKHGPILGQGAQGHEGGAGRSTVARNTDGSLYRDIDGNLWVYLGSTVIPPTPNNLLAYKGPNVQQLTLVGNVMSFPVAGAEGIANVSVIFDAGTFVLVFDGRGANGPPFWKLGVAGSTSPAGPFTNPTWPIPSLQIDGGMFGGPCLSKTGTTWALWYHASCLPQDAPTDIYRSTSQDLFTWTAPQLMIQRAGIVDYDQVGDPHAVRGPDGAVYAFWEGVNNPAESGSIYVSRPDVVTLPL